MDYKKIYTEDYFNGKNSFIYKGGYGRLKGLYFDGLFSQLKPYLQKLKTGRVLDVGCAYGLMLKRFPDAFEKFGVDVSDYAITEAKKRLFKATLRVINVEDEIPFPKEFFDVAICNDVLEHLENPSRALENTRNVLKKDGILYITAPNLNWLRKKFLGYVDKKEHHISLFSHRVLLDLLSKVGFEIIEHWTYLNLSLHFIKFKSNLGTESAFICRKL